VCSGIAVLNTREKVQTLSQGDSFIVPPNVAHSLAVEADATLAVLSLDLSKNIEENVRDLAESLYLSGSRLLFSGELHLSDLNKLQELALQLSEQPGFESFKVALNPAIDAVVKRLQEHPEESLSLDEMAAVAGYSRWHFLRLFQKEIGLTPHAFLIVCRLRLLRSLLRADTATAEAAVSAGFVDQSHMQKIFKLHHGLTPKQFRRASTSFAR
jgi:AraC-like DNA-binding protein